LFSRLYNAKPTKAVPHTIEYSGKNVNVDVISKNIPLAKYPPKRFFAKANCAK
jgi:hypothetical protein